MARPPVAVAAVIAGLTLAATTGEEVAVTVCTICAELTAVAGIEPMILPVLGSISKR
jgi:hypothetical protein